MNAKSPAVMVTVHQAKTQFSRLLTRAEAGEEVVIARNGDPVSSQGHAGARAGSARCGIGSSSIAASPNRSRKARALGSVIPCGFCSIPCSAVVVCRQ